MLQRPIDPQGITNMGQSDVLDLITILPRMAGNVLILQLALFHHASSQIEYRWQIVIIAKEKVNIT